MKRESNFQIEDDLLNEKNDLVDENQKYLFRIKRKKLNFEKEPLKILILDKKNLQQKEQLQQQNESEKVKADCQIQQIEVIKEKLNEDSVDEILKQIQFINEEQEAKKKQQEQQKKQDEVNFADYFNKLNIQSGKQLFLSLIKRDEFQEKKLIDQSEQFGQELRQSERKKKFGNFRQQIVDLNLEQKEGKLVLLEKEREVEEFIEDDNEEDYSQDYYQIDFRDLNKEEDDIAQIVEYSGIDNYYKQDENGMFIPYQENDAEDQKSHDSQDSNRESNSNNTYPDEEESEKIEDYEDDEDDVEEEEEEMEDEENQKNQKKNKKSEENQEEEYQKQLQNDLKMALFYSKMNYNQQVKQGMHKQEFEEN